MRGVERADTDADSFLKKEAWQSFCCGTLAESGGSDKNRAVPGCIPGAELLESSMGSEGWGGVRDSTHLTKQRNR